MNDIPLAIIDSSIKYFIVYASILAPICIGGLVFILKRIEKDNPEKIRWR